MLNRVNVKYYSKLAVLIKDVEKKMVSRVMERFCLIYFRFLILKEV